MKSYVTAVAPTEMGSVGDAEGDEDVTKAARDAYDEIFKLFEEKQ
jgi:hypothetical protein